MPSAWYGFSSVPCTPTSQGWPVRASYQTGVHDADEHAVTVACGPGDLMARTAAAFVQPGEREGVHGTGGTSSGSVAGQGFGHT